MVRELGGGGTGDGHAVGVGTRVFDAGGRAAAGRCSGPEAGIQVGKMDHGAGGQAVFNGVCLNRCVEGLQVAAAAPRIAAGARAGKMHDAYHEQDAKDGEYNAELQHSKPSMGATSLHDQAGQM